MALLRDLVTRDVIIITVTDFCGIRDVVFLWYPSAIYAAAPVTGWSQPLFVIGNIIYTSRVNRGRYMILLLRTVFAFTQSRIRFHIPALIIKENCFVKSPGLHSLYSFISSFRSCCARSVMIPAHQWAPWSQNFWKNEMSSHNNTIVWFVRGEIEGLYLYPLIL